MNSVELKNAFRVDVDDTVAPFLWSDVDIASYMDDAQKMFCRLTNGLSDSTTPAVCEVAVVAGTAVAPISDRILKIRRASRNSDGRPVTIVNVEDLDSKGIRLDNRAGRVDYIVTGMDEHKVRWVHTPDAADKVLLTVWRMPLLDITATTVVQNDPEENSPNIDPVVLEIDSQHHRALLLWMEHLAYLKQDADTINRKLSAEREADFRAYCFQATNEQNKARHKTRVTQFGGIGGIGGYGDFRGDRY